ncbi:MAG: hypothetical protein C4318_01270 [Acidimicrobiia bacterium]
MSKTTGKREGRRMTDEGAEKLFKSGHPPAVGGKRMLGRYGIALAVAVGVAAILWLFVFPWVMRLLPENF